MARDVVMSAADLAGAAQVELPLRGEWVALATPAAAVPSHGTNFFAQRYAFDFARTTGEARRFHEAPPLQTLLLALPAERFFCWDQEVLAAFPGKVVCALDGWPDRGWVNAFFELVRARVFPPRVSGSDYRPLTGNVVLVRGDPGVALYAHLKRGSVRVAQGDRVSSGQELGRVGNSGNSTMPHLHFQLMDGEDPLRARGVPCAFRSYERRVHGEWESVEGGVPGRWERIRSSALPA